MPSVTHEEPVIYTSKKRRRDDGGSSEIDAGHLPLYDPVSYWKAGFPPGSHLVSPRQFQVPDHAIIRTDNEGNTPYPHDVASSHHLLARKFLHNSPQNAKRVRVDVEDCGDSALLRAHQNPHSNACRDQRRIAVPFLRQQRNNAAAAAATTTATTDALQHTTANSRRTAPSSSSCSSSTVAPCHICAKRPTKKSDLDSYADCDGCGMRTCYVCMRECFGWGLGDEASGHHGARWYGLSSSSSPSSSPSASRMDHDRREGPVGRGAGGLDDGRPDDGGKNRDPLVRWTGGHEHRQMICSRCCVEQGPDGEAICLGCLQRR